MPRTCADHDVKIHTKYVSGAVTKFRELAEPTERGEKIQVILDRIMRQLRKHGLDLKYSRAYEIWYGRAKVTSEEGDAIAGAHHAKEVREASNDYYRLVAEMQKLGARLAKIDPDYHGETITALRLSVRGPR